MFRAKNFEPIGDHATNIVERLYHLIEGRSIAGERPKGDGNAIGILIERATRELRRGSLS
jgi:phosphate transport system protein